MDLRTITGRSAQFLVAVALMGMSTTLGMFRDSLTAGRSSTKLSSMSRRRKGDLRGHAAKRQLERIYKRYEAICQLCFKFCPREEASRDHVIEWCVGGSSDDSNIVLAHKSCNEEKSRNNGMSVKQYQIAADEWWPYMIGKEIKACIRRQQLGVNISARVPNRFHRDPEMLGKMYCAID